MLHTMRQHDKINDEVLDYYREKFGEFVYAIPAPRAEDGYNRPNTTVFIRSDGQIISVFHTSPTYYETPDGSWRPMTEICLHAGNTRIVLKPDAIGKMSQRHFMWLQRRQTAVGGTLKIGGMDYSGLQPHHYLYASTLTANSQTGGGGGNVTCDGRLNIDAGVSWAAAHDAANSDAAVTTDTSQYPNYTRLNGSTYVCYRGVYTFDTSSLTSSATITTADLNITTVADTVNGDNTTMGIVSVTLANNNNLATSDFNKTNFGTTTFATINLSSMSNNTQQDFSLNASGISNISKTGVTAFGTRNSLDISNTQPTLNNHAQMYFADNGSSIPSLVVVYTLPGASSATHSFSLLGVGN